MCCSRVARGVDSPMPLTTGNLNSPSTGRSRITPCASTRERSLPVRRNATGVRSVISTRIRLGITRWTWASSTHASDSIASRRSVSGTRTTLRPMSAENFSAIASGGTKRLPRTSIWFGAHQRYAGGIQQVGRGFVQRESHQSAAIPPTRMRRYSGQDLRLNLRLRISTGFCRRRYFGSSSASASAGR